MQNNSKRLMELVKELGKIRKRKASDSGDSNYGISSKALDTIHSEKNFNKAQCYWLGFLKGVAVSEGITNSELEPLIIHSHEFLSNFHDDDANELLCDLEQVWPDVSEEAEGIVENILDIRLREIHLTSGYNSLNMFYGYLKGIACDGKISEKELRELLFFLNEFPDLTKNPKIYDIMDKTKQVISDSVVDEEESSEICDWIARLVGDSFADTGITGSTDSGLGTELRHNLSIEEIKNKIIVITGTFKNYTRPEIKNLLEYHKVEVSKSVSRKTDFIIIAAEASKYWATPNAGTKLLKAEELRAKNGTPELVSERALERILQEIS